MKTLSEMIIGEQPKYSFGVAMLRLKIDGMATLQKKIKEEDIFDDDGTKGLEKDHHVTLLYGFHDGFDVKEVMEHCSSVEYPVFRLSSPTIFENDGFDVLKFDVSSPILKQVNAHLAANYEHTSRFNYNPHVTIAYLNSGMGKVYMESMKDLELTAFPGDIKVKDTLGNISTRKPMQMSTLSHLRA